LHLSSTKPLEISFEVGFTTGYGLVRKQKIVTQAKRTHNSVKKYYNGDTNNSLKSSIVHGFFTFAV